MIPETIIPELTISQWILVCGFMSTAFFSQISREKSFQLKILEVLALIAGSYFTLVNAIWFFGFAVILFNAALLIRLGFSLNAEPSAKSSPPEQGASGS